MREHPAQTRDQDALTSRPDARRGRLATSKPCNLLPLETIDQIPELCMVSPAEFELGAKFT